MVLSLTSCGIIPPWLSLTHTALDVGLQVETGKTSSEHLASGLTLKDCAWTRILWFDKMCMTKEEEVNYIMELDCPGVVAWNWMNQPYCKE